MPRCSRWAAARRRPRRSRRSTMSGGLGGRQTSLFPPLLVPLPAAASGLGASLCVGGGATRRQRRPWALRTPRAGPFFTQHRLVVALVVVVVVVVARPGTWHAFVRAASGRGDTSTQPSTTSKSWPTIALCAAHWQRTRRLVSLQSKALPLRCAISARPGPPQRKLGREPTTLLRLKTRGDAAHGDPRRAYQADSGAATRKRCKNDGTANEPAPRRRRDRPNVQRRAPQEITRAVGPSATTSSATFDFTKNMKGGEAGGDLMGFTTDKLFIVKEVNPGDQKNTPRLRRTMRPHLLDPHGSLLVGSSSTFLGKERISWMNNWMPPRYDARSIRWKN